jgi:dTMP kinase
VAVKREGEGWKCGNFLLFVPFFFFFPLVQNKNNYFSLLYFSFASKNKKKSRMAEKKRNYHCHYICLEGIEGVGKTTQAKALAEALKQRGARVFETKEPGTSHSPLTMKLRKIMLDNKYDKELTRSAREYVSQAARSVHLEKVIEPVICGKDYDFIIQDRGLYSGLAYGEACGNEREWLYKLADNTTQATIGSIGPLKWMYDMVFYLTGDIKSCLERAKRAKNEFKDGDVIESKNIEFFQHVERNFADLNQKYGMRVINIDGKTPEEVTSEILGFIFFANETED